MRIAYFGIILLSLSMSCGRKSMTEEQFDNFIEKCLDELESKQNSLIEKYNLGNKDEFFIDQETEKLQFKDEGKVVLEFKVVFIGTWAHKKENWLWAWANNSLLDDIKLKSIKLKGLSDITGKDIFSNEKIDNCTEDMVYGLVAMSVNHLNGLGMYRIPGERSHLYVCLMEKF